MTTAETTLLAFIHEYRPRDEVRIARLGRHSDPESLSFELFGVNLADLTQLDESALRTDWRATAAIKQLGRCLWWGAVRP